MAKNDRRSEREDLRSKGMVYGMAGYVPGVYTRELVPEGGLEGARACEEYRTQATGRDDYACNVEYAEGHTLRAYMAVKPGEYTEGGEDQYREEMGDYAQGYQVKLFGEQDEQREGNDAPPETNWPYNPGGSDPHRRGSY